LKTPNLPPGDLVPGTGQALHAGEITDHRRPVISREPTRNHVNSDAIHARLMAGNDFRCQPGGPGPQQTPRLPPRGREIELQAGASTLIDDYLNPPL
jgi:hypothetical protein